VSALRVTEGSSIAGSLAGLQSSASRLASLQSQLSSGRKITKPSDDPAGTVSALEARSQLAQTNQYSANGTDGLGWLSEVDSTMSSVNLALQSARTTTLQGLNAGGNDSTAYSALAKQIDAIKSTVLGLANTSYQGRPLFGGTTAGDVAFDATGAYVGNSGTVTRTIGNNDNVAVTAVGTDVFGTGTSSLFAILSKISTDLTANAPTQQADLQSDLSSLDAAMSTVSTQQSFAGANYDRIETVQKTSSATALQLTTQLSGLQDVDIADMAVQVSSANIAYQAALQTTANIHQTSLLDFLK
jgi:flagellar hook-associated protein 3 FlgL